MSISHLLLIVSVGMLVLELSLVHAGLVRGRYTWRDTCASLGMKVGNSISNLLLAGATVAAFAFFHRHRLIDVSMKSVPAWIALVVLDDFAYYWFHRLSHQCRFWWAAHVNHHSSQEYNLSTAARQPWTGVLAGTWAPWFVLALIGFPPAMIFLESGFNLFYQDWLHIQAVGRMPRWFEYLFNTPSHHRVHHAVNPRYLDRNYAGVFMIWDRLFGTFAEERADEAPQFGLVHNIETFNPLRIAFHEWFALFRDLFRARSVREAVGVVFGPPGWRADGRGQTSSNIRTAWQNRLASAGGISNG
jgi:sterol desaturase/sphingolipid hydroxylase (fatty acid hydroxylase superfamily)